MIEINDDSAAADIYTKIDSTTGDERQQMADALITYGEKKAKEEYNQADDHFSNLFLDEKYYAEQVNTPDLQQAYEATPFPKEAAKRSVLQGYLQHASGAPVSADTYEFIRDSYAQAKFGKTTVSDDEMFGLVRGEYDWQKQRTEAINDLQMQSVGKAIADSQLGQTRPFVDGMTEVFNQWQQKYPELVDGKNDAAFLSQGYKLYYDTFNDLDTVRPQASKALSTLTSSTQGNATDEDMQSLANDFVGAPPEDRQKIYKYVTLAAQAGQIDRAGIEQFAINMGQAFTRGFDFIPQGTLQMQEAGVNNWLESIRNGTQIWVPAEGDLTKAVVGNAPAGAESDAWRLASVPETETLIQSGQNVRESFKVVRELRNVAKTGVDPIRPVLEENSFWGTAERGAYGLAGSIAPMAATAVNPFLGALAYQATEYDRIMLENPDINPQFAQGLALVEGVANAATDRLEIANISGRLPMFGRYLDKIASDGVRRTAKIGGSIAFENLQEAGQDLIAPLLEAPIAALRDDMPDQDFGKLISDWAGQRPETFFATLPLALIGGGVASYRDIKNPSAELNATRLRQVGFDKEQTTFIQRAENPEEYDARIQMEWDKRTPENIEAGRQEVIAEMEQAATPDENSAKLSETVAEDGTRRWVVTAPDGRELLQTQDQQAALDAIAQHGNAQLLNKQFETAYEPVELRQMITDLSTQWTLQDSNNTLVMESQGMNAQQKLEQLQAAGNAAQIQELHNRIANSPIKDTPYDQINILGEASVDDVAEMVFKPLITINPNTRPENLREEIHHTAVKVAIKNGSVTLDTLRGWLDATEKALPGTFQNLVRDSEGDIVESLSKVQAAYENGKINADEETKLPPSFIGYIKNMMRTLAEVMRRAVALRGAFKDGALPAEYESFLADSVGLNQQARVDTVSNRVKGELTQGLFNYSIGQQVSTDTNFSIGNPAKVDENGIHSFAKPRPSTYANPNESEFDPSAILETLVRGKSSPDSTKRRKHGRPISSHAAFVDWAQRQNQTIGHSFFSEEQKIGSGGEHLVFSTGDRVYKLTKPGLFGIQADDAGAYLQRWALANRLFNDDARVEGIVKLPRESDYRTVISHRFIDGRDSTRAEIQDYLRSNGFVQVESQWVHPVLGIAALDADTAGNSITMPDGTVAPVDLNLQPATPQYLQQAREQSGLGAVSNFSIGIARNAISQVSKKDDASRVGTAKLGTAKVPKNTPQDSNVSGDNVPDDLLAKQMEKMNYAHLPKNILSEKDFKKKRRKLINWFKKNLLALHDAFPEEFRARATHWYDGANRIAKEMGSQFQASVEQASGVIAVFSPQKDWFMNVAQAEQFMELWTNSQDVVLEESLVRAEIEGIIEAATAPDKQKRKKVDGETKEQTAERREYNKALDDEAKAERRDKLEQVVGKTIRDLESTPILQGWAIRVLAQVTFGRNYRNLSPEGDRLGMATNDDGALAKNGWGSINEIEKAVRIMKDGSLKNISNNLGNEHKVRNFYNNIAAPNTPYGDATIDTHAVAAAHLMPYGAKATEVSHNFGSGMNGSEVLGISGVYHLYLDAYREAAADREILPRQIQSITWEAIRLVYPAATKNAATLAKSQKTWKDLTNDNARNTLVGGRIPSPVWAGANDNRESQALSSGIQKNGQGLDAGAGLLSGVRPTGAGRDGGVNYSIASQSEIDRVNRALGGMNRGPEGRLAIYERAKQKFAQVLQSNKESLDAINSATPIDTAPAIEQVESERASKLADLANEETTEVEKALQDNADTFMPRIEAAATPAERKRVERDAKDRAKILEKGIRDKYAERKTAIETEANTQSQQIEQSAASRDSASRARMSEKVRRTKLLQAIGELDAILSVLPPEVRGRVGGFAVLANIGTGDKALGDFFVKRIDMIDRQLERTLKEEYGTAFDSLLERTKPKKAAAGEKPKGIGADIQSLFAVVREARNWSAEKVDGHIANIETQIASGNLTAEEEAMLTREADLVSLAGDWKNADSSRRAAALSAATETWAKGMSAFVQKKIREREDRDMARAEAISATGKKGDYVGRRKRSAADNGLRGKVHGWFMDTLAWDGVVNILFGHESPMAIRLSDGQRKAEYAKIDAVAAKEEAIHDLFTKLADGNRAAGEKLMWQMSQPSISANGLNLSELEALSATMLWMQEDGRRHMEGELNENGMPVGKWHYDQKFIDDIESALSPEAKAVRDYLLDAYGKEWFSINSVYRDLNGVNLPRIQNYSPVTVVPINAPAGMVTDPVTGNSVSATSISPSALRTRGTAIAEPAFRNVVQTYLAHTRQMEHWKAFAPWIKEANGILRFRDVQNSIKEAGGEEATGVLNRYLDAFSQGGNRDASLGLEISQVLNRMASRAAQVALIGRVGTLAIQTTQIGAASAELPMGAYVYRLGKLLTGNLGWGDSLNSAYIQRRLKQMPPIVQIAMEGLKAGKPNQLKHQVEKIGRLISGSDALWTAGTYAMVYDYNLSQAKTLGYTGKAAEDYAHNTAERITDRLAQPTRMGAKSIYEVTATNPGSRLGWAFASEARKNLALLAYTKANRPLKRFGATALGFIVFNLAMGAFIRNAWKDIRDDGDDEDEFFDSKTWNWKRIGVAMATEPFQGIPYLGDYTEKGINAALGQYHQSSDLISFERGVRAIRNIPDIVQGEREMADVLKDIDGMVSLMGLFNQNAAAAASLTHIASDFFGVVENATED